MSELTVGKWFHNFEDLIHPNWNEAPNDAFAAVIHLWYDDFTTRFWYSDVTFSLFV